jgi:hypothetical protein
VVPVTAVKIIMSSPVPLLSIIVVSYNTKDFTLQTLRSVMAEINQFDSLRNQVEILVVDNNSQDASVSACEQFLAHQTDLASYTVFANPTNGGFSKANNQAIVKSKGEFILLLNSDTIIQAGALNQLLQTFQAHPIEEASAHLASAGATIDRLGLLSPTLLNPDNSIQPQGGDLPNLWTLFVQMSFLDDLPLIGRFFHSTQHTGRAAHANTAIQDLQPLGWIGGTAMMLRRSVIDEIGLLDENIFMYGEDVEYCLRAKHHHWDIAIDSAARVTHFGQASSNSENAILGEFKGYLYIWSKHFPPWQLPILKAILRWGASLRVILYKLRRQTQAVGTYTRALELLK